MASKLNPDPRIAKSPHKIIIEPPNMAEMAEKLDAIPEIPGHLNPETHGSNGRMGHSKHRRAPRGGHRRRG